MNLIIEFIPTWKFNFKDLPIKINSRNILITGTAHGYSANMYGNHHEKGEINLTFRDIEGIERVNIESFITEDMQEIGANKIPLDQTSMPTEKDGCTPIDEIWIPIIKEKLKELLA
tara:strand:+ start:887 stop:1234 length:348 start_codon:yes stop_codon:yes gene_type:complete